MSRVLKFCKSCLTTNLRPNASIGKNGVCIACQYTNFDMNHGAPSKLKALENKIKESKKNQRDKSAYDCLVGVSGGKDSTRQAHWVRDRLGLRPLLVCAAYPPRQMSSIGAKNLSNLIEKGFDLIVATPAPETSRKLTLQSFLEFGNVCKSTEISLFSTVPRLAIELGVNTIFWGENPALQVGDSATEGIDEFDGNNLRYLNTLVEGGLDWMDSAVKDKYKFNHYLYPDEIQFNKKNINIFYLGAAWDDWGLESNACYGALEGLTLRPYEEELTGDISNASMLDEEFTNINMMIKYFKFGFGRATDLVNEDIRLKKLTRDEGIKIVEKYDGICSDEIIDSYCSYVGISKSKFWDVVNTWTNKNIFHIKTGKRPKKKFKVGTDL